MKVDGFPPSDLLCISPYCQAYKILIVHHVMITVLYHRVLISLASMRSVIIQHGSEVRAWAIVMTSTLLWQSLQSLSKGFDLYKNLLDILFIFILSLSDRDSNFLLVKYNFWVIKCCNYKLLLLPRPRGLGWKWSLVTNECGQVVVMTTYRETRQDLVTCNVARLTSDYWRWPFWKGGGVSGCGLLKCISFNAVSNKKILN